MMNMINKASLYIQIFLWSCFTLNIFVKMITGYQQYLTSNMSGDVWMFRILIFMEVITMGINYIKHGSLKLFSMLSIIVTFTKLLLGWYYLELDTFPLWFLLLASSWGVWQIVVKLMNLINNQQFYQFYYNFFILWYLLRVVSSILILYDYKMRHNDSLSGVGVVMLWGFGIGFFGLSANAYIKLWERRDKFYRKSAERQRLNSSLKTN